MTINDTKSYAFVLDGEDKKLSPTPKNKAWFLIRKKRATLVNKFPMVIKLNKVVAESRLDTTDVIFGSDEGSKYTGVALIQKCKSKIKPLFKGTIELRQDVKHMMDIRRGYRRYKRQHKRHRPARFLNRGNSTRKLRVAPSVKQKRQSTIRVINQLNKYIRINKFVVEDVKVDIRAIVEGEKLYRWEYQKSNRLDENIRKAVIIRDNNSCVMCGKTNCMIEVHHITSRRQGGADSVLNLCCLCSKCHKKVTGVEDKYQERLYSAIKGRKFNSKIAQHVMQGKTYLYKSLTSIAPLELTDGGTTSNKRIDWGIDKSHSNDAIVICGLKISSKDIEIKDWIIKPMRRQSKGIVDEVDGFKHRDVIRYTKRDGNYYEGYIAALYSKKKQFNLTDFDGKTYKRYS